MERIQVVVCGILGKMGRESAKAVAGEKNMKIVGALDVNGLGEDSGLLVSNRANGIIIKDDMETVLRESGAEVMVDFTNPHAVMKNIETALRCGVVPVVGTSGIDEGDVEKIKGWTEDYKTAAVVVPNFAIGAVLMMKFARLAARYFPDVEVIEQHHEKKVDAPSGTAIKTAQMIYQGQLESARSRGSVSDGVFSPFPRPSEVEKVAGSRGGKLNGINLHSVRLPGRVAHQEVIFGGMGQTLTIRHDSIDRTSFMPGLIMAINEAVKVKGLVYGIENLIDFG